MSVPDERLLAALTRAAEAYGHRKPGPRGPEYWDGDTGAWLRAIESAGYRVVIPDFTGPDWLPSNVEESVRAGRAGGGSFDAVAALAVYQQDVEHFTRISGARNTAFMHKDDPTPEEFALREYSHEALLTEVRRRGLTLDDDHEPTKGMTP